MKSALAALLLFPLAALAQTADPIRNASGTASNPGPLSASISTHGDWKTLFDGAVFLTNVSQKGPAVQQRETFSTNWFAGAAERSLGSNGLVLFRVRGSLEPLTIKEEGYPQLFQTISPNSGGPLVDSMRAQDLISEAAVQLAYRTSDTSYAHIYLGAAGDPALGALPYVVRASSEEFAEAPFAYDLQESLHSATRVATIGFMSQPVAIEGGVFHHSVTTGRHSSISDGNIDSWSARITLNPMGNFSLQASHGVLGDDNVKVNSASASYGTQKAALSAIWTEVGGQRSTAVEALGRVSFVTLMARAESIKAQDRTHVTFGVIADLARRTSYRAGIGVNVDYHTRTRPLTPIYGHKPQSTYVFVRVRA